MPPANQGSKAALITWTVVATVFGVTMLVLALIFLADRTAAEQRAEQLRAEYSEIVAQTDLRTETVAALREQARQEATNVYTFLITRLENLSDASAGVRDFSAADSAIRQRLEQINEYETVQAANLAAGTDQLIAFAGQLQQERDGLQRTAEQLRAEMENQREVQRQQLAARDDQVGQLNEQVRELTAITEEYRERTAETATAITGQLNILAEGAGGAMQEMEEQIRRLQQQNTQLTRDLQTLSERFRAGRFVGDQMITEPDGTVIRAPQEGRLYISLGRNDRIVRGMTFEVYDSIQGVPRVTADTAEMPRGKASIEVVRLLPNSAEARVVRTSPGQNIREGDFIANLAYNAHVPVRFMVFGHFDLANTGSPTTRDRERLQALVQEFGGEVVNRVTVETDVLVLGQEPVIPAHSQEDLADPVVAQQIFDAEQRLQEYQAVERRARELNIPILNQNQFLFYIGYFEMARR